MDKKPVYHFDLFTYTRTGDFVMVTVFNRIAYVRCGDVKKFCWKKQIAVN